MAPTLAHVPLIVPSTEVNISTVVHVFTRFDKTVVSSITKEVALSVHMTLKMFLLIISWYEWFCGLFDDLCEKKGRWKNSCCAPWFCFLRGALVVKSCFFIKGEFQVHALFVLTLMFNSFILSIIDAYLFHVDAICFVYLNNKLGNCKCIGHYVDHIFHCTFSCVSLWVPRDSCINYIRKFQYMKSPRRKEFIADLSKYIWALYEELSRYILRLYFLWSELDSSIFLNKETFQQGKFEEV